MTTFLLIYVSVGLLISAAAWTISHREFPDLGPLQWGLFTFAMLVGWPLLIAVLLFGIARELPAELRRGRS